MESCIFCKIAARQIPAKVVFEDDDVIAFEDLSPQAPVHVLVIPKTHIGRLSEVKAEDAALLGKLLAAANRVVEEQGVLGSGCRFVINGDEAAGLSVSHLHLHVLGGRSFSWPPG